MNAPKTSKIHLSFKTFGIIIGIIGILHGSAELLQGNILVEGGKVPAMPENWPNIEFYTLMKGAPVFSLLSGIPYYVLGLLAISVSTTLIIFSANFFKLNFKGLILFALLSLGIFLFGAGEGTPIAVSIPLIITGFLSLLFTKKKERSKSNKRINLTGFSIFYWLQIFSWVLFFPGLFVLSFYQEIPKWLFLFDFMIMPISIIGAMIFGFRYDRTIEN
jgi:hypothetical protein